MSKQNEKATPATENKSVRGSTWLRVKEVAVNADRAVLDLSKIVAGSAQSLWVEAGSNLAGWREESANLKRELQAEGFNGETVGVYLSNALTVMQKAAKGDANAAKALEEWNAGNHMRSLTAVAKAARGNRGGSGGDTPEKKMGRIRKLAESTESVTEIDLFIDILEERKAVLEITSAPATAPAAVTA